MNEQIHHSKLKPQHSKINEAESLWVDRPCGLCPQIAPFWIGWK
jgi:hypothetical protein